MKEKINPRCQHGAYSEVRVGTVQPRPHPTSFPTTPKKKKKKVTFYLSQQSPISRNTS